MKKRYITSQQLLHDSLSLAADIVQSDFRPTFIIGVWRGGAPIGISVHEVLSVCGIECEHIAVRISSYTGIAQQAKQIRIHDINYLKDNLRREDKLLIVDDVHDSGSSIQALIERIKDECADNCPSEIRFAATYYKPANSKVSFAPDFFVKSTDDWLVFPHELSGLSIDELIDEKPEIGHIRKVLLNSMDS
jgi:hypoxanthine phosphoribosyltransferase